MFGPQEQQHQQQRSVAMVARAYAGRPYPERICGTGKIPYSVLCSSGCRFGILIIIILLDVSFQWIFLRPPRESVSISKQFQAKAMASHQDDRTTVLLLGPGRLPGHSVHEEFFRTYNVLSLPTLDTDLIRIKPDELASVEGIVIIHAVRRSPSH